MSVIKELKEIQLKLTSQQSEQLNNLYQEVLEMTQELKELQNNNHILQEHLSEKKKQKTQHVNKKKRMGTVDSSN